MNTKKQQKIDEIMYETNDKVSSIVSEIRQIRFSKLDEQEKNKKLDRLREVIMKRLSHKCNST
ncbi:MAG: hypothetical protein AABW66_03860 [Thermoproteota archaeon]